MALGVCRRFIADPMAAEDVLMEGFFKVLTKIGSFQGVGSLEGWIRRIMVNESLMHLRRHNELKFAQDLGPDVVLRAEDPSVLDELGARDILGMLDRMPAGYRTVFSLYVLEGYKHREIAELLGISINTSKSQLILARQRMEELLRTRLGYP
jgi:RNA polymerase sigma-70 factor (ECF subfamily)